MIYLDNDAQAASGNGRDIGNCPNPTSYPTADEAMDPNPAIYNTENVPTGLKCFHSGECHICKDGNPIAIDTNFNITGYVAIPVHTMIGGMSATYRKWKTQTTTDVSIPLNPAKSVINPNTLSTSDISNGCLISNEGTDGNCGDTLDSCGIMQTCNSNKADNENYNKCQPCSKSIH